MNACSNALDAIKYVRRWAPAVVISDVRMPEMDALELLSMIQRVAPGTRVHLLSAFGHEGIRRETIARGGEDLLAKPLATGMLLRAPDRLHAGDAR